MASDRLQASLLGRYAIERELGTGGMATVYLAHDLKHERKVAIKVLKPELAAVLGAERFVQEIKTTASLQHPHILPLFDSGEAEGQLYYVMPYVEGETVREKLNRETQFGVDEAVRIGREVADALDYAHRHGVIHRDIKPENILLHDGRALVMDFGIALAVSAAAGGRMTETGLSLGTPHYMSPEQATADRDITARSDIYSLASVLYEMLAGQPPHLAGSAQQIIMKIIAEPVQPVTTHRRNVPAHVSAALDKALEKLAADRFETAAKFSDALSNPSFARTTDTKIKAGTDGARGVSSRQFAATAAVAVLAIAVAGWLASRHTSPERAPVLRLQLALPDTLAFGPRIPGSRISISRDGSMMAYVLAPTRDVVEEQSRHVWYRPSDQLEPRMLPGSQGAGPMAVSADGKSVAFARSRTIFVSGLDGSPPRAIPNVTTGSVISWTPDGAAVLATLAPGGLVKIPVDGGRPSVLSSLDTATHEVSHFDADMLPNGKGIIFTVAHQPSSMASLYDVAILDLRTGKHRVLARGVVGRYAASGHLVYVTAEGALMAAPFDQDRLVLTGPPVAMGGGVEVRSDGSVDIAVSSTGTLLLRLGATEENRTSELVWVSRDGVVTPVDTAWRSSFDAVAISPDGRSIAVSIREPTREDVWIRQLDSRTLSKLTFDGTLNYRPSWLADGSRVAFISNADSSFDLVARRADGLGAVQRLAHEQRSLSQGLVSRDGKWIVIRTNATAKGRGDIEAVRMSDSAVVPLVATPAEERYPTLSPDGRWLAYRSSETGRPDVYVRPFPNVGDGKWSISPAGGNEPLWSHSGKELFYINDHDEMVSATVESVPAFSIRSQRVLFKIPTGIVREISHQAFDVAPDDRSFLMIRTIGASPSPAESRQPSTIVVVQNWFDELKEKVPGKR